MEYTALINQYPGRWPKALRTIPYFKNTPVVYILKTIGGCFKIGKSINMQQRLVSFRSHCPYPIEIYRLIPSDNIDELEELFLDYYREKKIHGEWFRLVDEDLAFINNFQECSTTDAA